LVETESRGSTDSRTSTAPALTPLARLRRLQIDWAIGSTEDLAKLIHAPTATVDSWLNTPLSSDAGTVPSGLEGVWRLLKIQDCLAPQIPQAEKQVEWLFTPRKDWEGGRPIDLISSSFEELSWLAYWLESVTNQAQDSEASETAETSAQAPHA
jgi:uncharacterized protein (DUF2384 family)